MERTLPEFIQLDPRKPKSEQPKVDLGIEDTLGISPINIDHHGTKDTSETPSACEQMLDLSELPQAQTIATVRPDADSVTAMAIYASRIEGRNINANLVTQIGAMDRLGPRALGTAWSPEASLKPMDAERTEEQKIVVTIARIAADFRKQLLERVKIVQEMLEGNITPDTEKLIAESVTARDKEFAEALAASKVTEWLPGKLVVVESTHRFATNIGYAYAPTVIAYNPSMPVMTSNPQTGKFEPTGETYVKFTVCRYDSNVKTNLEEALKELQALEAGWGGRGDIFGSPQNVSSKLSPEDVIETVQKYVR